MGLKTPLYDTHTRLGAKIVDFGGWDMPLHYGSQIEEHHAVRREAGMFDVSHMGIVDLRGAGAAPFLRHLLANDTAKLRAPGKGLYSCLLRDDAGVLDDLIVYRIEDEFFRMIVNAGTRAKDLAWMRARTAPFAVQIHERDDLAMIAVQGPEARHRTAQLFAGPVGDALLGLAPFVAAELGPVVFGTTHLDNCFIARTGYTGEDGFEIALPAAAAPAVWVSLMAQGIVAAGLGARDTLRLEAGFSLYGNDLDENHDPLDSGLAWTVAFEPADRDFVGRKALEKRRFGQTEEMAGLLLLDRGVLRSHQRVLTASGPGEITSGTFAPTIGRSIALARVPRGAAGRVQVEVRGKPLAALIVKPRFVHHGRVLISNETLGETP
ncbi:MAG: glycine cleavage system aminomethyltransferase GcvT [Steroidobacterales bacterium]